MRDQVDGGERARDRAGREDERDRGGEREPEDDEQNDERDRQRECLPAPEVGAEGAVQVVLDRRLPGYVGRRAALGAKLLPERLGPALRVLQVERGLDVAVEDADALADRPRVAGGHDAGRGCEPGGRRGALRRLRAKDDGERPVRPLGVAPLEDRACPVGVRARYGKRVREQGREPRRGPPAENRDYDPENEEGNTEAEDESSPALQHQASVVRCRLRRKPVCTVFSRRSLWPTTPRLSGVSSGNGRPRAPRPPDPHVCPLVKLGRLWKKGMRRVRITKMTSV